ncbi:MAG: glycosyltransferase family 2 protein [Candidatus Omnitrophota bacterium]|nr:MAG: glycosyltransferase family 2 protein [Candidatus Omnitrophota bacterium]
MKVLIYMPTYNTSKTLVQTISKIPKNLDCEYIVVDNGSKDNSVQLAKSLGLRVIRHYHNRGYGGSQKTAYIYAIGSKADVVVMLHSDDQYDPTLLNQILKPIKDDEADVVFGSRILGAKALEGGMPRYKYVSNRFLTRLENSALGTNISEFHSGYRAFRIKALEKIPFLFNSDSWLFDSEIIFQLVLARLRIKEISIPTKYHATASSIPFFESIIYGLGVLKLIIRFYLYRLGILKSKQFIFSARG